MVTSDKKKLMGYDPLAWMSENSESEVLEELNEAADMVQEQLVESDNALIAEVDIENEIDLQFTEVENSEADMNTPDDLHEDVVSKQPNDEEVIESNIKLEATLTIQHVVKLHEQLKQSYAAHDEIRLNAAQVSSIDTATLQLLVALKKDATQQQKSIVIAEPSSRFIESARLLGLLEVFELDA